MTQSRGAREHAAFGLVAVRACLRIVSGHADIGSDVERKGTSMNMAVEVHAPSQPVLVVGVLVALMALILYFTPGANTYAAFWLMTAAYVVASLGTLVKT